MNPYYFGDSINFHLIMWTGQRFQLYRENISSSGWRIGTNSIFHGLFFKPGEQLLVHEANEQSGHHDWGFYQSDVWPWLVT